MKYEVLEKLKKDEKYLKFLRQNSNWYKQLNRDPSSYDAFVREMKKKYKNTIISNTLINRLIRQFYKKGKQAHTYYPYIIYKYGLPKQT